VLRIVDRPFRRITLSLVDIAASEVPARQVRAALAEPFADMEPFELRFGPAIVNVAAIELYLEPSPALTALQARVADAYRSVFPCHEPAPVRKIYRGRSAIAYCTTDFPRRGLGRCPAPHPGPGRRIPRLHDDGRGPCRAR
jgi:hypothetical protein